MYCSHVPAQLQKDNSHIPFNNDKCLFKGSIYRCSVFPELYSCYVTKIQLFLWRAYWWAKQTVLMNYKKGKLIFKIKYCLSMLMI